MAELQKEISETSKLLNSLDQVLAKNPQLEEMLKQAMLATGQTADIKSTIPDSEKPLTRAELDQIMQERESKARLSAEIDSWLDQHKSELEAEGGQLATEMNARITTLGLPKTPQVMQLVFDALTGDKKAKETAEKALKQEEIANLDRSQASAVGGGTGQSRGKAQETGFSALVGHMGNPNSLR